MKFNKNYERAKKTGRASYATFDYLAEHGFDMTGIRREAPMVPVPISSRTAKRLDLEARIGQALQDLKEGY